MDVRPPRLRRRLARQRYRLPPAFRLQPDSEATSDVIDAKVRRIVEECLREAVQPERQAS